jgi:hypothetical protein
MTVLLKGFEWILILILAPIITIMLITMVVVFTCVGLAFLIALTISGVLLWLKELYSDWRS